MAKESERTELIENLKKGLFTKVAMEIDQQLQLAIVSANPRMKNLDVYDTQMSPVRNDKIFGELPKRSSCPGRNTRTARSRRRQMMLNKCNSNQEAGAAVKAFCYEQIIQQDR